MPFLNSNTKAFRNKVYEYLIDSVYDCDNMSKAEKVKHIWNRFDSEFNYSQNKIRFPNTQERIADWLAGLPLNIDYKYCDIIARSEQWHESTLTEKESDIVCANWFNFLSMKLLQLWESYEINPHN